MRKLDSIGVSQFTWIGERQCFLEKCKVKIFFWIDHNFYFYFNGCSFDHHFRFCLIFLTTAHPNFYSTSDHEKRPTAAAASVLQLLLQILNCFFPFFSSSDHDERLTAAVEAQSQASVWPLSSHKLWPSQSESKILTLTYFNSNVRLKVFAKNQK